MKNFFKIFSRWYTRKQAECKAYNAKIDKLQYGEWVNMTEREQARLEAQCKKDGITVAKHKPPFLMALNSATQELRCIPKDDGTFDCRFVCEDPRVYW